ncbi:hypothetical protein [Streptomyces mirabilis]|uniref:hypothetical protein n=1 Tax=Streptomyces mirabilis TaxID=68239 RepID=UPI0036B999A6
MEIVISGGKVAPGTDEITTPQAAKARRIANYLPRPELLRDAVIEHNQDDNTTSIRFETAAGPIRILLPVAQGFEFHIIHDSDTGPAFSEPSGVHPFRCAPSHSASVSFCGRAA